ncbi:hypothetical protein B0H14DRAFT_2824796 [Mycena olivaceomarginata]|nr:hypothetical protein B0H14DRAFT_2824796 [Mycena olivaceomarginata]
MIMQLKCEVRCKKGEREGKRRRVGGTRCRPRAHPHPPQPHSRTGKTTFGILSLPPPSVVLPDMYGVIKEAIKRRRTRKRYQVVEEGETPRSETRGVGDRVGKIEIERKRFDGHCHSRLPPNASAAKKKTIHAQTPRQLQPSTPVSRIHKVANKAGRVKSSDISKRGIWRRERKTRAGRRRGRRRGRGEPESERRKIRKGREGKMETKDEKGRKKKEGT